MLYGNDYTYRLWREKTRDTCHLLESSDLKREIIIFFLKDKEGRIWTGLAFSPTLHTAWYSFFLIPTYFHQHCHPSDHQREAAWNDSCGPCDQRAEHIRLNERNQMEVRWYLGLHWQSPQQRQQQLCAIQRSGLRTAATFSTAEQTISSLADGSMYFSCCWKPVTEAWLVCHPVPGDTGLNAFSTPLQNHMMSDLSVMANCPARREKMGGRGGMWVCVCDRGLYRKR